jgi:hypothetical protein
MSRQKGINIITLMRRARPKSAIFTTLLSPTNTFLFQEIHFEKGEPKKKSGRSVAKLGRWVAKLRRWVAKLGRRVA